MPMRRCNECRRLYDKSSAPGYRCPACEKTSERQRDQQRGNSTQRGYGGAHKAERERQIAAFVPGQPCARCGRPIATVNDADLGHDDQDRSQYKGLEHRRCNRGAPHRSGATPPSRWPAASRSQPVAEDEADDGDDWIGIA